MPVLLEPSNLSIADPYTCDLANAALNFAPLSARQASIWPIFCSASVQISAGSQQFINWGPYIVSARINMTARPTMLWILLSDIEIAYPVVTDRYVSVFRRPLYIVGRLNKVKHLQTTACQPHCGTLASSTRKIFQPDATPQFLLTTRTLHSFSCAKFLGDETCHILIEVIHKTAGSTCQQNFLSLYCRTVYLVPLNADPKAVNTSSYRRDNFVYWRAVTLWNNPQYLCVYWCV